MPDSQGREGKGREGKGHSVGSADPTGFALLWGTHPGPKGPKQDAVKAFREVHLPENVAALLLAQVKYKQDCDKRGEFCPQLPHLHRWLKKRRWEDEVSASQNTLKEADQAWHVSRSHKVEMTTRGNGHRIWRCWGPPGHAGMCAEGKQES